jgi:hypothetical protein
VADVNEERSGSGPSDGGSQAAGDYCRQVEAYLCQKNDGHLIRIAGPSFSRVSGWARQGIPLNVVYRGIDRYFDRYYTRGPRRRPVHIDFCEGDVLAVFEEWRRAVGFAGPDTVTEAAHADPAACPERSRPERSHAARGELAQREQHARRQGDAAPVSGTAEARPAASLRAHLDRVIVRLTTLRAGGRLAPAADATLDSAIRELDGRRGSGGEMTGDDRLAAIDRLRALDAQVVAAVAAGLPEHERREIEREAEAELAPFRAGMAADAYERAVATSSTRLVRQRTGLPVIAYED